MRWKLLVLVSVVAALLASVFWFLVIIVFFNGSSAILRVDGALWPLSLVIPFLPATFAAFFVYRHTSRKRKTQAAITILTVLILTALLCFTVIGLLRNRAVTYTSPVASVLGPNPISFCTGFKESITNRMCWSRSTSSSWAPW